MTVRLHRGDLPDLARYPDAVAIDTETMGLNPHRDRLCVVQLSKGDGSADVVQIPKGHTDAPNLKALLADPKVTKIFHFARFDVAVLYHAFGVMPQPVYCTKIASRLARTYTDRHGLKDLVARCSTSICRSSSRSSDWGAQRLSEAQLAYAASDVLHLHALRERLDPCWPARARTDWRRPASTSCRPGRARSAGWGTTTSSHIREPGSGNSPVSFIVLDPSSPGGSVTIARFALARLSASALHRVRRAPMPQLA